MKKLQSLKKYISSDKASQRLFLATASLCLLFVLLGALISSYISSILSQTKDPLRNYVSDNFAANIDKLYFSDIDETLSEFMDSPSVTSFFFCTSTQPASAPLLRRLQDDLDDITKHASYISCAAVYAAASDTYVVSSTKNLSSKDLNNLLTDLIYSYNSNSVDKIAISSDNYNSFLFKYGDYIVFSKDLSTINGSSYSTTFYLMDSETFFSFASKANGMLDYKMSIYDSHDALLFTNSSNKVKANYRTLTSLTSQGKDSLTKNGTVYLYCVSEILGIQYLIESDAGSIFSNFGVFILFTLFILIAVFFLFKLLIRFIQDKRLQFDNLESEVSTMKDVIHATSADALSHLFAKIILGTVVSSDEAIITLENTGYGFTTSDIYIAGLLHHDAEGPLSPDLRFKLINVLNLAFDKFKEKHDCHLFAFIMDDKSVAIIASFPAGTSIAKGKVTINSLVQEIEEAFVLEKLPVTVSFGHMYSSILDIAFSYNEACRLFMSKDLIVNSKKKTVENSVQSFDNVTKTEVITSDTIPALDTPDTIPSDSEYESMDESIERIERRSVQIVQVVYEEKEGLDKLIERCLDKIFENEDISSQAVLSKRLISSVTSNMLSYPFINDSHLTNVYEDLTAAIESNPTCDALRSSLEQALSTLCQDFSAAIKKQRNPYVTAAKNYIEEHYANPNLSLEEIAEELKIAPNYLSSIFSKNLGVKLFEFVNEYRLNKSIELLLDTKMSVNDIAEACGFGSSRNYIRIFKKYKDNTPGAYRKQH